MAVQPTDVSNHQLSSPIHSKDFSAAEKTRRVSTLLHPDSFEHVPTSDEPNFSPLAPNAELRTLRIAQPQPETRVSLERMSSLLSQYYH